MDKERKEQINSMVEYIIERTFPIPSMYEGNGIGWNEDLIQKIRKLRDELKAKPYEEIKQYKRQVTEKIEQQRFYNRPNARANLEEAIKLPYWTLDEAVAYSLNKNPTLVNWQSIKRHADESPFVKKYKKCSFRVCLQISELIFNKQLSAVII